MEGTKKKIPVILRVWDKDTVTVPIRKDTFTMNEKSKCFNVRGPDITLGELYMEYLFKYIAEKYYFGSVVGNGWIKNKTPSSIAEDGSKFATTMIGSDGYITWDFALDHEYYTKICHTPELFLSSEGRKMVAPGPVSNVQQLVPSKSAVAFSVDMQTTVSPPPPPQQKQTNTTTLAIIQPISQFNTLCQLLNKLTILKISI